MSIPKCILICTVYVVLSLAGSPALVADEAEKKGRGEALIEAVRKGDGTAASALLGEGADANARDRSGTTALMWATLDASPDTMKVLLEKGAAVNARNEAGATALMYAVSSLEKVQLLLGRGAEVDARDENGCTALILAAGYDGPVEIVKALVDRGADVNARAADDVGKAGVTPLMRAARSGDRDKVTLLLGRGGDVKVRNKKNGLTALWLAAKGNDIPTVRLLLDRGADTDARFLPYAGTTLLMEAAYAGSVDLMGVLLDRGVDLEARDDLGMTALMWAASNDDGEVEALKLLLARGADRDAKDKGGRTALMLAKDAQPTPAMSLLASPVSAGRRGLPPDRVAAAGRAVERSIPLLERSGPGFFEGATGLCISCHHQSLPALTLAAVHERGFRLDEATTRLRVEQTLASMPKRAEILDGVSGTFVNPSVEVSYLLVGLAADGQPPSAATEALVHQLAGWQARDGRWPSLFRRAPLEHSDVTATALAMRALKAYAPPGRAGEMDDRIRRARAWLAAVAPRTTEERSFQLLGLAWAEGDPAAIGKGAAALLAEQRPDGGWAQVPARASDAYATGQALVALHQAGGLAVDDLAYRRGVDFLLGSQYEDGSWLVETRSHPRRRLPYFETGFPHGDSQFISCAGTAWATWALALTVAPPK
jgi:ankyrin repeat protein